MGYKDWPWDTRSGHLGQTYSSLENPKVCVHTTETRGFPNYDWPPHITYDIANDRGRWHVPAGKGAYALVGGNPSANKDGGPVFQIEVVAYAKDSPTQTDEWYARLSALLNEVCEDLNVPKILHPKGFVQTGAYGPNGVNRLSWDEYKAFSGILGHQHAPAPNAHWDPGNLDESRLTLTATPPFDPLEKPVTPEQLAVLLSAINSVPRKVWADRPGGATGPSTYQTLIRTKADTGLLVRDLAGLSVDELVEAIQELPDDVVTALYRRLAPGPA